MVTDTIMRLRAALKLPGFTKLALSEKAGLHRNTLLGCEDENWDPKASTLRAIEPFLPPIDDDGEAVAEQQAEAA
jgi:DNA-binding XRE family transcriptional regulator